MPLLGSVFSATTSFTHQDDDKDAGQYGGSDGNQGFVHVPEECKKNAFVYISREII